MVSGHVAGSVIEKIITRKPMQMLIKRTHQIFDTAMVFSCYSGLFGYLGTRSISLYASKHEDVHILSSGFAPLIAAGLFHATPFNGRNEFNYKTIHHVNS